MEGDKGSGLRQVLLLLLLFEVLLLKIGRVPACVHAGGIISRAWKTDDGSEPRSQQDFWTSGVIRSVILPLGIKTCNC